MFRSLSRCASLALVAAVAIVGIAAELQAQTASPIDHVADSAAVVAAVNAYDRALSSGDSSAVLELLLDDAVILESGGLETRDEYRSHHLPADIQFAKAVPASRSHISVRIAGDVAWAWSTSHREGTFRGRAMNSTGAELMVLRRTASGWRIAAIHWSSRERR